MAGLPEYKTRQAEKLDRKTHRRSEEGERVEVVVVKGEFNIERKQAGRKQVYEPDYGTYYEGYASIFSTADSYKDIIQPGAFKKSLKEKGPKLDKKTGTLDVDIPVLWQHNPDWPFAFAAVLEEDSTGLYHKTHVPINDTNMERLDWIENRIIKGNSIGFVTLDSDWDEEDEDEYWPTRYIKAIDLWEHSTVTFPAHSDALTEFVQRNREIALAVKSADHGRVLEFATKNRGITLPAVEEAIAIFKSYAHVLKSEEGAIESEEDQDGDGEVNDEAAHTGTPESGEEDSGPDPEDPIASGETSEEDSEFIKALEDFAFETKVHSVRQAIKSGGR